MDRTTIHAQSRDIKIVSWNVHGIMRASEGLKTQDKCFADLINSHKIFCLQETKREIFVPNYRCINKTRNGSKSGGLCVGIHRSLSDGIVQLKTRSDDILAVRLTTDSSGITPPLFIINIYDSPEASSFKKRKKTEQSLSTMDQLLEFFSTGIITQQDRVLLTGDFNARTGSLNHNPCFQTDRFDFAGNAAAHDPSGPVNSSERASQDKTLNPRGKLLMDLLACTDMSLLNGCTLGDAMGEYTCQTYNGTSVVDYTAVSYNLQRLVDSFRILDMTDLSDHRPCSISLNIRNSTINADILLDAMQSAPVKYKWDADNPEIGKMFREGLLTENIKEMSNKILRINCTNDKDVFQLNGLIADIYNDVATDLFPSKRNTKPSKVRNKTKKIQPKQCWFDGDCINAKRKLRSLAKRYGKSPRETTIRDEYFSMRRTYRQLISAKKSTFIESLSADISQGKNINWKRMKQLKQLKTSTSNLDVFDMNNFVEFFKNLYAKKELPRATCKVMDGYKSLSSVYPAEDQQTSDTLENILNRGIDSTELRDSIRSLKNGKAVAEDRIANEFLKNSCELVLQAVLHLFNECLRLGVYPWSTSVVTPLHKKGSVYDPNNYRAIAVSSNLGKLFANILLSRLIKFRAIHHPDTVNQLGFCKNAQTSDHALTLHTSIEKYVKHGRVKLYTCFVDFAKAFDSVSREALLYKLWRMGVRGKFYNCLEYMYTNSKAKVKLLSKLSEEMDILAGTEQGHPMSPELFKCYIHELSEELNSCEDVNIPELAGRGISHLLWADDLVLMALDALSLQKLLGTLHRFCSEWGLSVNTSKTAVMIFNIRGRLLKESYSFKYGSDSIPTTREYCYLGTVFSLSGSMTINQQKLKQKAFRAYFSLKSSIDMRAVNKLALFQLFDALILPIASYGSQVWLPSTGAVKAFLSEKPSTDILKAVAADPLERIHLTFLKWTLGVGKRTSNAAIWGDTGRLPLALSQIKHVFQYAWRLCDMVKSDSPSLARFAFEEQCNLQLPWFRHLTGMYELCTGKKFDLDEQRLSPAALNADLTKAFIHTWEEARVSNRKLQFYNAIKTEFGLEAYLWPSLRIDSKEVKRVAQLRSSSHGYGVETGRWADKRHSTTARLCPSCCDLKSVELISELPFFDPIVENEEHVLRTCPAYQDLRLRISPTNKTILFSEIGQMFHPELISETARFIRRIHERRHPKKEPDGKPNAQPKEGPRNTN